ncbi:DNA internalization-related competence protein ComEC/Rec2 [Virgibacillus phasianinus]|uniref:DNA internalization-related competence protein ComEC/Rec2 n=1 Tax=Virgibacillus phasianinus TaxID=2017483 RepID=A0A220U4C8_9BACI|nr:DNA internalization-related competence protein ComEC/Rec2 [Virgibacillus phasianinus]ASK63134.1 DNA internalization-related competence protein ComEC/Rec2 [Virgibacillus phasianinus]
MKGYWHIFALSVLVSIVTVIYNNRAFMILLVMWFLYLYIRKKLRIGPIVLALLFYFGCYFYIPTIDTGMISTTAEQAINGEISGTINSPVKKSSKKIEFVVKEIASGDKILAVAFINKEKNWENKLKDLRYGATCSIKGILELPNHSRNPGQFDYRSYLFSKGITYQLTLSSADNISCESSSLLSSIFQIRTSILNFIISKTDPYTAKWLNALVLGDDSQLDQETIELFQRWSLSHLLAISGLHVGLIVSIIYFLLIKLSILTKEKAQWAMICILPFYALIAGGEPSVWRACLMVILFILLHKIKVVYSLTDVLSIIFLLLIVVDKYIVYHVGFQLSFLVTLGLLLSGKWIASSSNSPLTISLKISFVAQMMIIPLQLAYFYTFQPLSILMNVIVVPYFSLFVIPVMFFMLLLSPFPAPLLLLFNAIFETVHRYFIHLIQFIDQTAYFPYILGSMPLYAVILYYVVFLLCMNAIQRERSLRAMQYGCLIVFLLTFIAVKPYLSPYGTITMLDIGQGDSFIVELPYRKAVFFVDAGAKMSFETNQATDSTYKQVIKPYLYANGIAGVDALFLTHEDVDHVGSVPYMIEGLNVERVFINEFYNIPGETLRNWQQKGVNFNRLKAGQEIDFQNYPIHILSPYRDKQDTNANSLVLYMKLGGLGWLFTGDIDKQTEIEIMKRYSNVSFNVLKIAHHGSKSSTSTQFLEHYKPSVALISVGEKNSYGHPAKEVLDTLEKKGITIFRTDRDGAVQYKFKGENGTFFKYLP